MRASALVLPVLLLAAAPAAAQSPFDGTWKADVSSLHIDAKPDRLLLKAGTFTCASCTPTPYSIKVDGAFHPVKDRPYWDEQSVTIVDPHTVKRELRLNGKTIAGITDTVSADGTVLTTSYWNTNNAAGIRESGTSSEKRIGTPVTGAHLISGSWQAAPPSAASSSAMTMNIKVDGRTLRMTSPRGETLTATIGGGYAPNVGDPGKTMTKAAMSGPRTLMLTDMRAGKVVQTSTYVVSPDGRTLTGTWKDPVAGATGGFTAHKE